MNKAQWIALMRLFKRVISLLHTIRLSGGLESKVADDMAKRNMRDCVPDELLPEDYREEP